MAIKIYAKLQTNYSGTCESNGFQELSSEHECSLATGNKVANITDTINPPHCFEYTPDE